MCVCSERMQIHFLSFQSRRVTCGVKIKVRLISSSVCDEGTVSGILTSFSGLFALFANEGFLDVLFRGSKLAMLLSESLGNINCQTTMIAHISDSPANYLETLTTVQLASRIHLTRRTRRSKVLQALFHLRQEGR